MDQVRPGEIDGEEIALGPILSRHQPSLLDPCLQHLCAEWRIRDKLVGLHPHTPMAPLGASTLVGRHCAMSFSSSGSGVSGSITFRVTCSSPRRRAAAHPFLSDEPPCRYWSISVPSSSPRPTESAPSPCRRARPPSVKSEVRRRCRRPCG